MTDPAQSVNCYAVVPAAGTGQRMGSDQPKQYLPLLGKTVMEHTLEKLLTETRLQKIIVVTSANDSHWRHLAVLQNPRIAVIEGGDERCHSVLNGLRYLAAHSAADNDWVLVHDVARPCIALQDIQKMIEQLGSDAVGGILALPVSDTIKQVDSTATIISTIDRSQLWQAQTPQMFRLGILLNAMAAAIDNHHNITDEASAIELSGLRPTVVEGSRNNIKITRPEDLSLAEYYLQLEQSSCA